MKVFTVGYEGMSIDQFTSLLSQHGIQTIVDVRELPLSRKRGFSKKALSSFLALSGVGYVHLPSLGCPKTVRDRYKADGDWSRYTTGFSRHLQDQATAIAGLAELVGASNCALMCYEADFNYCHRSMVANALRESHNVEVSHLKAASVRTATPAAPQLAFA
jgi:uncharacterized protein (DUF488 family)